jgi:voltage-gated potassium channel Kch
VTLTTVGYGDVTPTSDFSRLFTIVYILIGLGVLVAFTSSIARHYIQHKVEAAGAVQTRLSAHVHHDQPAGDGDPS